MSIFNEEIHSAIGFYLTHSHINMLFKILESGLTDASDTQYLHDLLKQEISEYLTTYGAEIPAYNDVTDILNRIEKAEQ